MSKLIRTLRHKRVDTLVISAGGAYGFEDLVQQQANRAVFYRNLSWHPNIKEMLGTVKPKSLYLGLHHRTGDYASRSPGLAEYINPTAEVSHRLGIQDIYISTDASEATIASMKALLSEFRVHIQPQRFLGRGSIQADRTAVVDFLTLGGAQCTIRSSYSSFGEEASLLNEQPELGYVLKERASSRFGRLVSGEFLR